jgi:hypothetical protein
MKMKDYVPRALYVHTANTTHVIEQLENHSSRPTIIPVSLDKFEARPQNFLESADHVVISGPLSAIKIVNRMAVEYGYSVGTIPTDNQKKLAQFYDIPSDIDAAIDLALGADPIAIDLVFCNDHLVLFKATV